MYRLTQADYARERAALGERKDAGARWDQSLAKLFYRSGWTQEELAEAERKGTGKSVSRRHIGRMLQFGRFLEFGPTGPFVEKLPERRFRDYWDRTDNAEINERARFQQVVRLIEDSTLAAPRRPMIGQKIVKEFADGKWHRGYAMAVTPRAAPEAARRGRRGRRGSRPPRRLTGTS